MHIKIKTIIYLLIFLLHFNHSFANDKYNIVINGNDSIDKKIILSLLEDNITQNESEIVNLISKKLYATGMFEEIAIKFEDNNLIINLIEYPLLRNIYFVDNERFKKQELLDLYDQIIDNKFYNKKNIDKFIKELLNLYKSFGYNQININHQIKPSESNDLNFFDINFFIDEGKISKINKVKFAGNNSYDYSSLINIITSKPKRELLFFLKKNYKEFEVNKDVIKLIKFYQNNGYKDVVVTSKVEFISDVNRFNLFFIINEGPKYQFSNFDIKFDMMSVSDSLKVDAKSLIDSYNKFLLKKNSFNVDTVLKIRSELSDLVYNSGVNFFEVQINENIINSQVDIFFNIKNIQPNYVNLIHIKGNRLTQDYVVRRELEFSEGDPINDKLIEDSINNIKSLEFFKDVKINQIITNKGLDVYVEVDEANSGDFSVGLAFGTIEGATFISKLNQKNIAGTGKSVEVSINTASKNTEYKLNISQPRFFGRKVEFFYGLNYNFDDKASTSSYKLENFTGNIGFAFKLNSSFSNRISLLYELNDYDITNQTSVSSNILSNSGTNAVIKLQNNLNYYNLDSFIRPKDGEQFVISSIFSPITNSKDGFIKNTITAKKFYNYKKYIFSLQAKLGNITSLQDDSISDSEKFSLGGKWLRGFDIYGAGPRNSTTSYIGGNNLAVSKIDISRSLFTNSSNPIDLFIFTDFGKVFDNKKNPTSSKESLRASGGYGIKLFSPIGPIGLTWGFPILDESYDIKREFLFSIGNLN